MTLVSVFIMLIKKDGTLVKLPISETEDQMANIILNGMGAKIQQLG
jgi:hypothetical protein